MGAELRLTRSHADSDDTRALAQHARKDREAANELLCRLLPRIEHTVFLMVGGSDQAPDLVNRCAVEILKSVKRFEGRSSPERWAQRLVYRVVMRHMKTHRSQQRTLQPVAVDSASGRTDVETDVYDTQLRQRLAHHLGRIPEERRITLVLRVVMGHSVPEVAELTNVPLNTARDRIRVALKELRRSIAKDAMFGELTGAVTK